MGYIGHSMSVNARNAYNRGLKPKTKWTKEKIIEEISDWAFHLSLYRDDDNEMLSREQEEQLYKIPLRVLQEALLRWEEWHHTGYFMNVTDFYSCHIDDDFNNVTELIEYLQRSKK